MNKNPKVSVIIPTFNQAAYIKEAIDSVLKQTYKDFEIIVVDDGSFDGTLSVLEMYGNVIQYYYQKNKGPGAARNLGVQKSRGEYIAFLDSDDIWLPEKLHIQVSLLDLNLKLAFVCSAAYVFRNKEGVIKLWEKPKDIEESFECLLENNFISTLTVMMRKSCFKAVGGFDERLSNAQDYDLWLRLTKNNYKFYYINIPLAKYRHHESSNTRNIDKRVKSYKLLLKKKELWSAMQLFKKRKRLAGIHYDFAKTYLAKDQYQKATWQYLKALCYHPAIGVYSLDTKDKRSVFYNFFRIYYLIFKCGLKVLVR